MPFSISRCEMAAAPSEPSAKSTSVQREGADIMIELAKSVVDTLERLHLEQQKLFREVASIGSILRWSVLGGVIAAAIGCYSVYHLNQQAIDLRGGQAQIEGLVSRIFPLRGQ